MHSRATVRTALDLAAEGLTARAISQRLGISHWTVRDWLRGAVPHSAAVGVCDRCLQRHALESLPPAYVYVLGLYLGDGCLSCHARQVFKLRIILDRAYPGIINEAVRTVTEVSGRATVLARPDRCVEVYAFWRSWICLFPQHAPGKKHDRSIALTSWQQHLVAQRPDLLLRGLIHSDGCRFINSGRNGWRAPRYAFSNHSADIHTIFRDACDLIGVRWTAAGAHTTYVSRQADVAVLDTFIGPKR